MANIEPISIARICAKEREGRDEMERNRSEQMHYVNALTLEKSSIFGGRSVMAIWVKACAYVASFHLCV